MLNMSDSQSQVFISWVKPVDLVAICESQFGLCIDMWSHMDWLSSFKRQRAINVKFSRNIIWLQNGLKEYFSPF